MGNIINISFRNSKNPIINKLKINKETYFDLDTTIRYDYSFIKEIINEFKYDLPFLERVLEDINKNVKEDWTLEFNIQYIHLLEGLKQYDIKGYLTNESIIPIDLKLNVYKIIISTQCNIFMDNLEKAINEENASIVGMGFLIVQDMFNYSEIIQNYYAEEFIRKIFQNPSIETYLHQNFKGFEDIEKNGLTTFIINYIALSDESLAYYVINHSEVLGEIRYALDCIKSSWQSYIASEQNDIFSAISEDVFNYIQNHKTTDKNSDIADNIERIWEAAYYAAYKLGIFEDFFNNAVSPNSEYMEELRDSFDEFNLEEKSYNFKRDYKSIKELMQSHINKVTDLSYQLVLQKKDDKKR